MSSQFVNNMPVASLCGWIPHEVRTTEEKATNDQLLLGMPQFKIFGSWKAEEKVCLWDAAKVIYAGKHLKCFHQDTGSCVGQGKAKAEWYVACVEVVRLGDLEQVVMPYEPFGYAQSRVCAGITGRSSGSTGTGAAEAARRYGVLRSDLPGLPAWEEKGETIYWSGSVDDQWGYRGAPAEWLPKAKSHPIRTTSLLKSVDDMVAALHNWYPCTIASNWGGEMRPPVKGTKYPVLLNSHADTWNHQMMVCAVWDHPELGLIFYVQNSWGENAHGQAPDGSPAGGFWVRAKDMAYIIAQNEAFAYSQFDGFPAQELDKKLFKVFGR